MENEIALNGAQKKEMSIFGSVEGFEFAQRAATALSKSTIVPKDYQNNISNCIVALNLAARTKQDPFMVMQNLDIIHGRPSWNAKFIIAVINSCGKYDSLRFKIEGTGDQMSCVAYATDIRNGEVLESEKITIAMAKQEGWYTRSGSKWPTMPKQMLQYRAASFFARLYCPEILLGMQSSDESADIVNVPIKDVTNEMAEVNQPAAPVAQAAPAAKTGKTKKETPAAAEEVSFEMLPPEHGTESPGADGNLF
jgi:hypothetical protein